MSAFPVYFLCLNTLLKNSDGNRPVIFVLFGATGDLAVKKIFPALAALAAEGKLGSAHQVVAVSRREWTDVDFHAFLAEKSDAKLDPDFLSCVSYVRADVERCIGFDDLAAAVKKLQAAMPDAEVLYYASLAPVHQRGMIESLKKAKLLERSGPHSGAKDLPKLLLEKPFGTDLKSARALDKLLLSFLREDQIYRVDHYLGKDTVRAIMDLRENTPHFLDVVSRENVASIRVRIFEQKGIDGRGASYDSVGAFRDVGQNHILEMLAVLIAELPKARNANRALAVNWNAARAKALARLAPPAKTCALSRRGQYEGYLSEANVEPDSETETAFEVITNLSSGKLKGVPILLEAGKKMPRSEAFVEIAFKEVSDLPVRMTFRVQQDQDILIENRDGSVDAFEIPKTRDAYGNVILAALEGSLRGFAGADEIEALWSYADRIVACWSKVPLEVYGPTKPLRSLIQ